MAGVFRFGTDLWDPSHRFETSWILSPWALFACRATIACYAFFVQFFVLGWECQHASAGGCTAAGQEFSYFTVLTYWGLAFYFLVAAVHTFTYARTGTALMDRLPRPLQALHAAYYASVTVYPFIVTIVFWGKLYPGSWWPDTFDGWSNVSEHAMNSGYALFEIIFTRTAPHQMLHMLWLIVVLALYLAVAYVTRAAQGWYPYDFLDPVETPNGLVAAYVFGIAIGCIVVFLIVTGLIWLRVWVTEKKLGMAGKFADERAAAVKREDAEMAHLHGDDAAAAKDRVAAGEESRPAT